MKFCQNCGAQIDDNAKFCTECGTKVETVQVSPAQPAAPVYEAPAQPAAPVYEAPAQPAAPVYEAPAQPAAPVYEAPAQPAAPVYEAPAQPAAPVYEAPAQPAAPMYQAPAQPAATVYEAPAQPAAPVYEAPAQPAAPVYEAPAQPATPVYQAPGSVPYNNVPDQGPSASKKQAAPKKPINPKVFIFGGIGLAVVLAVVLLIALLGGGKAQGSPADLGVYNGTSCVVGSMELGAKDEWVELKEKGKVTLFILGDEYNGSWELDGNKLTVKQNDDKFDGTLSSGTLKINIAGMDYTFTKDKAANAATPADTASNTKTENTEPTTAPGGNTAADKAPLGTYKAVSGKADGTDIDADLLAMLGDMYVVFEEGGSGSIYLFGETAPISYDDKKITIGDYSLDYTFDGVELVMQDSDGTSYTAVKTNESVPEHAEDIPGEVIGEDNEYEVWNGDYYGWWIIYDVWEGDDSYEGNWWDSCASVNIGSDGIGSITIWDENTEKSAPMIEAGLSASVLGDGTFRFCSEDGYFRNDVVEHADWLYYSDETEYDDLLQFTGTYEEEGFEFDYKIFLVKWGSDWAQMIQDDPDLLPFYFDNWYLPLIEDGVTEAPDTIN
ncbi:MAG: zinc-ribbon domain-containing protein [Clostridiales bacterium]|nr:zinc-ribbon domain-containing protein [Clostridiales bacterium]